MQVNDIKVLIASKLDKVAKEILEKEGMAVEVNEDTTEDWFKENINNYDAVIVRSEKITEDIIDAGSRLKLVVRAGSGVNTIAVEHAGEKNILVMNTPDANSNSVAELVFGYMLVASRNITKGDVSVKNAEWIKKQLMGTELAEKTLGIIGVGNIGSRLIRKAKAFDMNVIAYDPILTKERAEELGIELCTMEEIFDRSNFVTVHVPLNPNTKGFITYELMKKLPEDGMIMNAARAEVINEQDLKKILSERPKMHIAMDLFYEGDVPGEKSIAEFGDQVVMTPHLGASTFDANFRAARNSAQQIAAFFNKGIIQNSVNILKVPEELDPKFMLLARNLGLFAYHMVAGTGRVTEVKLTCYGDLYPHTGVLQKSAIKGVLDNYIEETITPTMAETIAEENGIRITAREPDEVKGHRKSITVDVLVQDDGTLHETSVRGTINEEDSLVVRRVDDYSDVNIFPIGNVGVFTYKDRPGVSGKIGDILSEKNINILDGRYKTSGDGQNALAALRTDADIPDEVIGQIGQEISAEKAFSIHFVS